MRTTLASVILAFSAPVLAADAAQGQAPAETAPKAQQSAQAGAGSEPAAAATDAAAQSNSKKRPKTSKRSRAPREKEAEGTEAFDRSEADPVVKSPYQLNGKPLEVDPD